MPLPLAALERRLIGHVRHGPITEVTRQTTDPAPMAASWRRQG